MRDGRRHFPQISQGLRLGDFFFQFLVFVNIGGAGNKANHFAGIIARGRNGQNDRDFASVLGPVDDFSSPKSVFGI